MDIRIGITNSGRELAFESGATAQEVEETVAAALSPNASPYFTLADSKGKTFIIPVANLAYVEIGSEESRRIGFVG